MKLDEPTGNSVSCSDRRMCDLPVHNIDARLDSGLPSAGFLETVIGEELDKSMGDIGEGLCRGAGAVHSGNDSSHTGGSTDRAY